MTDVKNELPIAVHIASGGDARIRREGVVIPLSGVSGGSFQVVNATQYRALANMRSTSSLIIIIGHTNPVTLINGSAVLMDMDDFVENVAEGSTIHFAILHPETLQPALAGGDDYLYVSLYG